MTLHQQCKLRPGRPMMRHKRTKSRLHFGLNWLRPLSFHPQLFNASPEQPGQSCSAGRPLMKGFQMERLFRASQRSYQPPFKSRIRELAKPCPDPHPQRPRAKKQTSAPAPPLSNPRPTHFSPPLLSVFNEAVIYLWPAKSCSNPTPDNNSSVTVFLKHASRALAADPQAPALWILLSNLICTCCM